MGGRKAGDERGRGRGGKGGIRNRGKVLHTKSISKLRFLTIKQKTKCAILRVIKCFPKYVESIL